MAEENTDRDRTSGAGHTLGLERWVMFGFIGSALIAFWLLDHIIGAVWNIFQDPSTTLVTGTAAVVSILAAVICYRIPKYHRFVTEVSVELSKVTWPTRKETWAQTVVVVIVSIIAAVILGVFDAAWSAVTDLIYKT
jgi:preprotein translocase subunit SecE